MPRKTTPTDPKDRGEDPERSKSSMTISYPTLKTTMMTPPQIAMRIRSLLRIIPPDRVGSASYIKSWRISTQSQSEDNLFWLVCEVESLYCLPRSRDPPMKSWRSPYLRFLKVFLAFFVWIPYPWNCCLLWSLSKQSYCYFLSVIRTVAICSSPSKAWLRRLLRQNLETYQFIALFFICFWLLIQ